MFQVMRAPGCGAVAGIRLELVPWLRGRGGKEVFAGTGRSVALLARCQAKHQPSTQLRPFRTRQGDSGCFEEGLLIEVEGSGEA